MPDDAEQERTKPDHDRDSQEDPTDTGEADRTQRSSEDSTYVSRRTELDAFATRVPEDEATEIPAGPAVPPEPPQAPVSEQGKRRPGDEASPVQFPAEHLPNEELVPPLMVGGVPVHDGDTQIGPSKPTDGADTDRPTPAPQVHPVDPAPDGGAGQTVVAQPSRFSHTHAPARLQLLCMTPGVCQTLTVVTGDASIGRDPDNDVVISHDSVSSRHAVLTREGRYYYVEDVGSKNGTYVGRRRISGPTRLCPGDILTIGTTRFEVAGGAGRQPRWLRSARVGAAALVVVVVIVAVWPGRTKPPIEVTGVTQRIGQLVREGNHAEALKLIDANPGAGTETQRRTWRDGCQLGMSKQRMKDAYHRGDYSSARVWALQVLERDPDNRRAREVRHASDHMLGLRRHFRQAEQHRRTRSFQRAIEFYQQVIRSGETSEDPQAQDLVANARQAAQLVAQQMAEAKLRQEIERFRDQQQFNEEFQALKRLARRRPDDKGVAREVRALERFLEGTRARGEGQYDEAIRKWCEIPASDPHYRLAVKYIGQANEQRGAQREMAQAQKAYQDGRLDEARRHLDVFLQERPNHPQATALRHKVGRIEALCNLAEAAKKRGDRMEEVKCRHQVLQVEPDASMSVHRQAADCIRELRTVLEAKAKASLEEAAKLLPQYTRAGGLTSETLLNTRDDKRFKEQLALLCRARTCYQQACDLNEYLALGWDDQIKTLSPIDEHIIMACQTLFNAGYTLQARQHDPRGALVYYNRVLQFPEFPANKSRALAQQQKQLIMGKR